MKTAMSPFVYRDPTISLPEKLGNLQRGWRGDHPEKASEDMKKLGADVAVFIQENPESAITLLNASEQRWTILNASAITADARNEVFAAARIRKELTRGFLCAAGAMNSLYQGSMMAAIKEPKDLDKMLEDPPPDNL